MDNNNPQPVEPEIEMMGSPKRGDGVTYDSFIAPLEDLEILAEQLRQEDLKQLYKFFEDPIPPVTQEMRDMVFNKIYTPKENNKQTPFPPLDIPDDAAIALTCGKRLIRCGHPCQEPASSVGHRCGKLCTFVKKIGRDCGHEAHIYCGRLTANMKCMKGCRKQIACGHSCRRMCHYPEECNSFCDDYYCRKMQQNIMQSAAEALENN